MFKYSIPRIVVSGLRGGSGKTILSLCLIASWHKKGLKISPFKKGPDYIDAGWLAKAACTPCYNLDLFMMSPEQIVQSFISHTLTPSPSSPPIKGGEIKRVPSPLEGEGQGEGGSSNHIAVIEGNRGLYDGVDHEGTYSTAQLAKLLKAPVIMVIDCTKATSTIAAMVLGCQKMDNDVSIRGVVLNQIATSRQELLIRKAINEKCKLPVLGVIPRLKKDPFPERHMGLTPFQEYLDADKSLDIATKIGSKYLDLNGIWRVADKARTIKVRDQGQGARGQGRNLSLHHSITPSLKIGVIRDSAFQFYYPENFEELEKRGAKLIELSPLRERKLPDIDALYIGGGFPETHAIPLAENISFKNSLKSAIENGLPVYAECGGLMYLGKSLVLNNKTYSMAGVIPIAFGLEKKPQAHGYTIIKVAKANPYFPKGSILKGHEFHYSRVLNIEKHENLPSPPFVKGGMGGFSEQIYMAFKVQRGNGIKDGMDGICYKNVLATYTHLHALGAPEWAEGLIRCALGFKNRRMSKF